MFVLFRKVKCFKVFIPSSKSFDPDPKLFQNFLGLSRLPNVDSRRPLSSLLDKIETTDRKLIMSLLLIYYDQHHNELKVTICFFFEIFRLVFLIVLNDFDCSKRKKDNCN